MTASPEFLGVGWRFPIEVDAAAGEVEVAAYEEAIRQSIWIILGTARGERPMRPDFGCGIHDLVFAVGGATTSAAIADAVRDALIRWEPRIELLDVRAAHDVDRPTRLDVLVQYRVRTTNSVFNLVYPFYLDGGGG